MEIQSILTKVTLINQDHPLAKLTLSEFFQQEGYSKFFYDNYIIPMTAAIWSSPADVTFNQFPVLTLIKFMRNHCLLQIGKRPKWKTVMNGSISYIEPALKGVSDIRTNTAVVGVVRRAYQGEDDSGKDGITLIDSKGAQSTFDHVIMATHSDQALKILGSEATPKEIEILGISN